jgi:hypothetical protein
LGCELGVFSARVSAGSAKAAPTACRKVRRGKTFLLLDIGTLLDIEKLSFVEMNSVVVNFAQNFLPHGTVIIVAQPVLKSPETLATGT